MAEDFATVTDVETRWRPLTESEQVTCQALLDDASAMIRAEVADTDDIDPALTRSVCCSMVKRAMISIELAGASSVQQSAGPYAQSVSFANPTGDLYMTATERRLLGGRVQHAFTVELDSPPLDVPVPDGDGTLVATWPWKPTL